MYVLITPSTLQAVQRGPLMGKPYALQPYHPLYPLL